MKTMKFYGKALDTLRSFISLLSLQTSRRFRDGFMAINIQNKKHKLNLCLKVLLKLAKTISIAMLRRLW